MRVSGSQSLCSVIRGCVCIEFSSKNCEHGNNSMDVGLPNFQMSPCYNVWDLYILHTVYVSSSWLNNQDSLMRIGAPFKRGTIYLIFDVNWSGPAKKNKNLTRLPRRQQQRRFKKSKCSSGLLCPACSGYVGDHSAGCGICPANVLECFLMFWNVS